MTLIGKKEAVTQMNGKERQNRANSETVSPQKRGGAENAEANESGLWSHRKNVTQNGRGNEGG